jgi:UDP-N-acetylmuramate dehydrogenase
MEIEEGVPLSTLTTFRTGGPARFLITCAGAEELPEARAFALSNGVRFIPLGGGSNLLAPDTEIDAAFVRLSADAIVQEKTSTGIRYRVAAGRTWDSFVLRTVEDGAWGIENLSGIPGSAGAAAVQNIGAYGAALSDTFESATAFDIKNSSFVVFDRDTCAFGYRTSIFKEMRDQYMITELSLRLSETPKPNLSYRDLALRFGNTTPRLEEIRDAVIEIRKEKFPPLDSFGTAGSFFLNPVLPRGEALAIRERFPEMPLFDMPEGGVKVPLGWIFDHVLHLKERKEGRAFVWEKQALVIALQNGGSAEDVRALAEKITQETKEKTGITITPEVRAL